MEGQVKFKTPLDERFNFSHCKIEIVISCSES